MDNLHKNYLLNAAEENVQKQLEAMNFIATKTEDEEMLSVLNFILKNNQELIDLINQIRYL